MNTNFFFSNVYVNIFFFNVQYKFFFSQLVALGWGVALAQGLARLTPGSALDGNQGGPSLKDPLQVPYGPITRSRAKKIKEAMQGLVKSTWDEASKSPTLKMGLKEKEPILIHLIQAVEDMTQGYCLGLLLLKGFNLLNDLSYQFRISGLEDASPTYILFLMNQGQGYFWEKELYFGQGFNQILV